MRPCLDFFEHGFTLDLATAVSFSADVFLYRFVRSIFFTMQQLQSDSSCMEMAAALSLLLSNSANAADVASFASQWVTHLDASLLTDVGGSSSIYQFSDTYQRPVASAWLQVACTIAEEGMELYCSQPNSVLNLVWNVLFFKAE